MKKDKRVEERVAIQPRKLDSIPNNIAKKNMSVIYKSKQQQRSPLRET
jgi:hypothetical protein